MDIKAYWRKCGSCKKEINYRAIYQKCSVSSCRKLVYCSVSCWDTHVPVMNHKSAWAQEERAPAHDQQVESSGPRRRIVSSAKTLNTSAVPKDILIVASKLKAYIKSKHNLNCSSDVLAPLSDIVRRACDDACEKARMDGRKTLLDRDF